MLCDAPASGCLSQSAGQKQCFDKLQGKIEISLDLDCDCQWLLVWACNEFQAMLQSLCKCDRTSGSLPEPLCSLCFLHHSKIVQAVP